MSKRDNNSSLILQNLKKRDLRHLGDPIVPLAEAERRLSSGTAATPSDMNDRSAAATQHDSGWTIMTDSNTASVLASSSGNTEEVQRGRATRLKPRERAARSALLVRLDPNLHRELETVARYNRLTMNDIAIEAIELHVKNFPHPGDVEPQDRDKP